MSATSYSRLRPGHWALRAALLACALFVPPRYAWAEPVVKLVAPRSPLRAGPGTDYVRTAILPPGLKLAVVERRGTWLKVRLAETLSAWVHEPLTEPLPKGTQPSRAKVTDISIGNYELGRRAVISVSAPVPYRTIQRVEPPELVLDLFQTALAHYGVREKPGPDFIHTVERHQVGTDWARITFGFKHHQQTGYDVYYQDQEHLVVDIRAPYRNGSLAGKRIVLDPGHGGTDRGAVGPTGLLEKEVNLDIALELARLLRARGAEVILLREGDVGVAPSSAGKTEELSARREYSKQQAPDLFLSIHSNSVGVGSDPEQVRGTETYYWTQQSIAPAKLIQEALCRALGTENRYVSWRPFYVLRETDTPRVLVECAYMSNPGEEQLLAQQTFRQKAARGLFEGLSYFFATAAE